MSTDWIFQSNILVESCSQKNKKIKTLTLLQNLDIDPFITLHF